jgi:hypothetical protein
MAYKDKEKQINGRKIKCQTKTEQDQEVAREDQEMEEVKVKEELVEKE